MTPTSLEFDSCPECGSAISVGTHCIRCGTETQSASRGFAASPTEPTYLPSVASTLFPQLPRSSLWPFRFALVGGAAVLAGLGAAGLFPLGLMAAAVLVPLLVVLYVYAVDVYEDEPLRVLALTVAWGILAGVGFGILERAVAPDATALPFTSTTWLVTVEGVLLAAVAVVLAAAGPFALLPYERFNDVLDGATFGVTSAAAFAGSSVIASSSGLFAEGFRPVADADVWIFRLLQQGIATPLLFAGAIGGLAGSAWLRYRAPARDRHRLGALGHPLVAFVVAGLLVAAARVAVIELTPWQALLVSIVLVTAALLWLRLVIHVGLVEESFEGNEGPSVVCANCGNDTPSYGFCAHCGVALKALPKARAAA
jgi:hypothetical protein